MSCNWNCSRLWAMLLALPPLSACSADVTELEGGGLNPAQTELGWDEYRDASTRTLDERKYYVTEGDLVFTSEAALKAHYDARSRPIDGSVEKLHVFKRASDDMEPTFPPDEAVRLDYCVSDLFATWVDSPGKDQVVAEVAQAMSDWQNTVNVRFIYHPGEDANCDENNANVDFAVVPTSFPIGACASNKMMWSGPAMGCPNSSSNIVTGGILSFNYSSAQPVPSNVGVYRHELGHMLGFRHEHPFNPAGSCTRETPNMQGDDLTFRALTDYDSSSVMHYSFFPCGLLVEYEISPLDGVGARSVYGMPAAWHVTLG